MSGTNLCYYSNKCQWSKAFVTELSKTPWKNEFRFICVDASPSRPQLPACLKKVPAIVIPGESEPRTDSDVMNWLYEKRMKEGQQTGAPAAAAGAAEPSAFSMMENVSFAKGFSYSGLDVDTSSQGMGGTTMPGAFSFLSGAAAEGDRASQGLAAAPANSQRRSKKEEMFDKQIEAYQRDRDSVMPKQGMGRL